MKQLLCLFALLILFSSQASAQDYPLYWKYKDYDGAIPVQAPRWLITMGSWFVPGKQNRKMVRKVHKARVIVFEDGNPISQKDIDKFNKRASRRKLDDLIRVRTGKTHVRVMAREKKDAIRKVVIFVSTPKEFVLMSLRGKLKINELIDTIKDINPDQMDEDIFPDIIKPPPVRV